MKREVKNGFRYESIEALFKGQKADYRRLHGTETEDLHYQFETIRTGEKSGFLKVKRLEGSADWPNAQDATLEVEDNRVVAMHLPDELPPGAERHWWFEA